jgi:peptide-N4-(N-acetyl-beta-glucosaminyl)asparagine amidase
MSESQDPRVLLIQRKLQSNASLRPRNSFEQHSLSQVLGVLGRLCLYRDQSLRQEVYRLVPWEKLSLNASRRVRQAKLLLKDGETATELNPSDVFLVELLEWFKTQFYTWFQSPTCSCVCADGSSADASSTAGHAMRFTGIVQPTSNESKWLANFVELYVCDRCKSSTRFARYNHPLQLLQTRTGRCGEWANCFAAICVALNYDVRIVLESGDHVWVEVLSEGQQRWLHCDPCEQALDTPFMYEQGWKKEITLCLAVGSYEIQDVTWAYTLSADTVIARRKSKCREEWLSSVILFVNHHLQLLLSPEKKNALRRRTVFELTNYLRLPGQRSTRALKENESQGRSSGSLQWRLARGESHQVVSCGSTVKPNTFKVNSSQLNAGQSEVIIRYDVVRDMYRFGNQSLAGWTSGAFTFDKVFRKVETDWKMVYLSRLDRLPADQVGRIEWAVDWQDLARQWKEITINVDAACYHDARVQLYLIAGQSTLTLKTNQMNRITDEDIPKSNQSFILKVELSGSEGELAWQHAQLFRQSLDKKDMYGLHICIKF